MDIETLTAKIIVEYSRQQLYMLMWEDDDIFMVSHIKIILQKLFQIVSGTVSRFHPDNKTNCKIEKNIIAYASEYENHLFAEDAWKILLLNYLRKYGLYFGLSIKKLNVDDGTSRTLMCSEIIELVGMLL